MTTNRALAGSCLFVAALTLFGPAAQADWDADLSTGAFTGEELKIRAEIFKEFKRMGPRAYVLPGTVVYLHREHRSRYYNINADGLRQADSVGDKRTGETRILMMGGSTIFGPSVADDQTIPAHLEDRLRAAYPDRAIEVYNLGLPAYTFQRELALAKLKADKLKPDLIVFYHGINDALWAYNGAYGAFKTFDRNEESEFITLQRTEGWFPAAARVTYRLRRSLKQIATGERDVDARAREFARGYLADVRKAHAYFARKRIEALFLVQPVLGTRKSRTPREEKIYAAIPALAHSSRFYNIYCHLLRTDFKTARLPVVVMSDALDSNADEVYFDEAHMGPTGNRIMAEKILKTLENQGWPRIAGQPARSKRKADGEFSR